MDFGKSMSRELKGFWLSKAEVKTIPEKCKTNPDA